MFNKSYKTTRVEYAPAYPQEVHHHGLPPDKAADLIQQFQDEAERRVVARETLEINNVTGEVTVLHSPVDPGFHVHTRININGQVYEGKATIKRTWCTLTKEEKLAHFNDVIVDAVKNSLRLGDVSLLEDY